MKKFLTIALAASFLFFSCVKENENGKTDNSGQDSTEESEELTPEEQFWKVVGQLVDRNERTPDYKTKTFKPTIGDPDNGDESIRIVLVNDLGAAVSRYNTLVDANITDETASHNYNNPEVGQLTWTKSTDNTAWGTVDVDIQQVPSLHKIIYRSPKQGDANGGVYGGGSAYYRFGDVIRREVEDGLGEHEEYWICVRPAFDKEGKGKSHWVSVSPLPEANLWPYYDEHKPFTASNEFNYSLPYNIGDDLEWHQDLAEMLFAIMYPHQWATNLQSHFKTTAGIITGLRMFNDWNYNDYGSYHNEDFWKNVQNQWKAKRVVEEVFGTSYQTLANALAPDGSGCGLHLLYNGYSWSTRFSNKPKLYEVHYSNSTTDGKKMNMHLVTKTSRQAQVVDPKKTTESNINYSFDFYDRQNGADADNFEDDVPFITESRFFGDGHPRWVVRYAEGEELSENGVDNNQLCLKGFDPATNGKHELYRYYRDVFPGKHLSDPPEETNETNSYGFSGRAHYRWGSVYKDEEGAKWFVFNQSGYYNEGLDNSLNERSPYTELISFDPVGFRTNGKNAVTNLATRDQALRAMIFMYSLLSNISILDTEEKLKGNDYFGLTTYNILQNAGVDLRTVFQGVISQNTAYRPGAATCIAYKKSDNEIDKQHLLRVVINIQNVKQDPQFYCWNCYPKTPDLTTQFVTSFSSNEIYLQDIANQNMVDTYAKDTYAVQPLSRYTLAGSDEKTPRSIRTQADSKANDVTNYYYNLNAFQNVTYPGDMWNEPILMFRYTRVRDCGDDNYDTKTVDGHTLTLVKEREWTVPNMTDDRDAAYDHYKDFPSVVWQMAKNSFYLDGMSYNLVSWDKLEVNK